MGLMRKMKICSEILRDNIGFSSCQLTQEQAHSLYENKYTDSVSEHAADQSNCSSDEKVNSKIIQTRIYVCKYTCKRVGVS